MKKRLAQTALLLAPFLFSACTLENEPTTEFENRVFQNREANNQQLAFYDGGLYADSEIGIKPTMTDADQEDLAENPEAYEPVEIEEVQVFDIGNGQYEVRDGEEVVFTFSYDEASSTITTEEDLKYVEQEL